MEATMHHSEVQELIDSIKVKPTPQFVTLPYYGDVNDQRTYQRCPSVDDAERICTLQSHIVFETLNGDARTCKVNGRVRRWKRDRQRIEIPLKYGLYEYSVFTLHDIPR